MDVSPGKELLAVVYFTISTSTYLGNILSSGLIMVP